MQIHKTLLTNLHSRIWICGGVRERVFYGIGRRGSCGNAASNFGSVNLECPRQSLVPPLSVRDGRRTISGHLVSNICPPICRRGRGGAGCFRGMQTTLAVSGLSASDRADLTVNLTVKNGRPDNLTQLQVTILGIQGSAKRSADFVKQQPGRARQKC